MQFLNNNKHLQDKISCLIIIGKKTSIAWVFGMSNDYTS